MNALLSSIPAAAFQVLSAVTAPAAPMTPGDEAADTYRTMLSDAWFVRHSIIICGLLLFLLVCFFIRRRRRTLQIFANAGGKVQVAHSALAELVENIVRDYGAASRPRACFKMQGGRMQVWVRLKIGSGQRLQSYSSALQTRVAEGLREAFGITELGGVHIIVTGYTGTPVLPEESSVPYHGAAPAKPAKPVKPAGGRPADDDYFGPH
jgi:hypothetical protein